MKQINYVFNGGELFIVNSFDKKYFKLTKLKAITKTLINLNNDICKFLVTYDFKNIDNCEIFYLAKTKMHKLTASTLGFLNNIEKYSFLIEYLYFLEMELQILAGTKFITNTEKYHDITYDNKEKYDKILNLISV